jgi:general secretion pathway protein L
MRIDFRRQVTWESVQTGAREFGHWWISEMLALLPDGRRAAIEAWLARPVMRLDGSRWLVSWPHSGLADIAIDASLADAAFRNALRRESGDRLDRPICFELPGREVLRRTIRLPAAALARLRSAVELQLGRYSPFRSEDVAFDCIVPPGAVRDGEVEAEVAIVPRATLKRYQDWLARLGLTAAEFRVERSGHRFYRALSDWRPDSRSLPFAIAAAGLLLWMGAYLVAPSLREGEIANETGQVNALRAASGDAARAKDTLDRLSGSAAFLARKEQVSTPLDALEVLTLGFPNNTSLTDLVIEGDRVRASGVTADVSLLMEVLGKSNRFSDIRMSGPGGRMADGRSRFTIDLTLQPAARMAATR